MGKVSFITVEVQDKPLTIEVPAAMQEKIGERLFIKFESKDIHVFDPSTEDCLTAY